MFGSYARNENLPDSDIDIFVKFKSSLSLVQLVHIERMISQKLGIKADLVTIGAIRNKIVKENIHKDLQIIYHTPRFPGKI
ncbi:MAG: nucleotidyltransferase domain-containing protein [Bacteroidales bacterium]|nr:nucleotidyltransferase domain-containing protein [Lentimicrobiaceae bacterium]MDD5695172.1 nucleotidyltransferase domain-containing protein [Bacteroidales bacterium]